MAKRYKKKMLDPSSRGREINKVKVRKDSPDSFLIHGPTASSLASSYKKGNEEYIFNPFSSRKNVKAPVDELTLMYLKIVENRSPSNQFNLTTQDCWLSEDGLDILQYLDYNSEKIFGLWSEETMPENVEMANQEEMKELKVVKKMNGSIYSDLNVNCELKTPKKRYLVSPEIHEKISPKRRLLRSQSKKLAYRESSGQE